VSKLSFSSSCQVEKEQHRLIPSDDLSKITGRQTGRYPAAHPEHDPRLDRGPCLKAIVSDAAPQSHPRLTAAPHESIAQLAAPRWSAIGCDADSQLTPPSMRPANIRARSAEDCSEGPLTQRFVPSNAEMPPLSAGRPIVSAAASHSLHLVGADVPGVAALLRVKGLLKAGRREHIRYLDRRIRYLSPVSSAVRTSKAASMAYSVRPLAEISITTRGPSSLFASSVATGSRPKVEPIRPALKHATASTSLKYERFQRIIRIASVKAAERPSSVGLDQGIATGFAVVNAASLRSGIVRVRKTETPNEPGKRPGPVASAIRAISPRKNGRASTSVPRIVVGSCTGILASSAARTFRASGARPAIARHHANGITKPRSIIKPVGCNVLNADDSGISIRASMSLGYSAHHDA